jgi:hypothetical protein
LVYQEPGSIKFSNFLQVIPTPTSTKWRDEKGINGMHKKHGEKGKWGMDMPAGGDYQQ